MKVRIISVKHGNCWYKNKIGIKFDVKHWSINRYRLNGRAAYIYKSDCEIVEGEMIDKLVGVLPNCPLSELDIEQDDINGEHYRQMAIEPLDYSMANKHNPCQAKVIKYVSRYPFKGGIKDLRKAEKMLARLIEYEIGNEL